MRSYAREVAFCKLYAYLISGIVDNDFSQFEQDKLTDEDRNFASGLVNGVAEQKVSLDQCIADLSDGFKISRIYKPDLAALEMAIWELTNTDTPKPVVINEAVTIVKKYSTEKSVSYVNGILAAYLRRCQ